MASRSRYCRSFKPRLAPTLFTIPAILLMIGLCFWQVQRLHWKEGQIAERQTRTAAAPIALPPPGDNLAAVVFRRVSTSGVFRHDKELYLAARSLNGNVGYHVLTPFELTDGGAVLVDRGWVPIERKMPDARAAGQVAGIETVIGFIRLPQKKAWMQPENEAAHNVWFYVDPRAMAEASGIDMRTDLYLEADAAANPGGFPIGGQTRVDLPNDHLQYAITWGLLALALAVIYVVYHLNLEDKTLDGEGKEGSS